MAEAIEKADRALEVWPAPRDVPDSEKSAAELLGDWTRRGLILSRKTVALIEAELDRQGLEIDPKLLRLGNDSAQAAARLSMRAAEGEFRARQGNALEKLLEQLAIENAKLASKKG